MFQLSATDSYTNCNCRIWLLRWIRTVTISHVLTASSPSPSECQQVTLHLLTTRVLSAVLGQQGGDNWSGGKGARETPPWLYRQSSLSSFPHFHTPYTCSVTCSSPRCLCGRSTPKSRSASPNLQVNTFSQSNLISVNDHFLVLMWSEGIPISHESSDWGGNKKLITSA